MKTNEVWVYIEQNNGKIAEVSLELLVKATTLANKVGVKIGAVLLGNNVKNLSKTLMSYGADKIYCAEDKNLKDYTTLPYAKVVVELIKEHQPQIVLYGATTTGRDVAPRIASELKVENKIKFRNLDAQHLECPNNSFNAIFMFDALQHIEDKEAALKECIRILDENGILCVIETNKNGIDYFEKNYSFTIDYVDPRTIIKDENTSIKVLEGKHANFYILRKII